MPKYKKQNGELAPTVVLEKTWVEIPVESQKKSTMKNTETYLVPPSVADYIELLESKISGDIPELPITV